MATTTNYSWSTPDDTALVKDGAAAIRSLGTAIDTTVFNNAGAAIAKTIVDAKGDIIAATASDTVARLAVGANDTVLTADSTTATGLKWAAPAGSSGPTFGVYLSANQSITGSTYTKVQFNTEEWDSDSCFDSTTNYRFTPNKAGYYQINYTVADSGSDIYGRLYKNGSNFKGLWGSGVSGAQISGSCMVYANGTTDYFEFYLAHFGGTAPIYGGQTATFASGAWIRG